MRAARGGRPASRARAVATNAAAASAARPHALITGANTGIGFETAKDLASKGFAVTLACRDDAKAAAAARAIRSHAPGADVATLSLDLASLANVRDAANAVLDGGRRIDVLVNNAGVMAPPDRLVTADGFELQIGVNHLGHFAFTARLWPALRRREEPAAAAAAGGGLPAAAAKRLVVVSSSAHLIPGMDLGDLNWTSRKYSPWGAYGASKLANVMFCYHLARALPSPAAADASSQHAPLAANALMPGVVRTELSRYIMPNRESLQARALALLTLPFTLNPTEGAQTSIRLASSPELEGVTGKYYDVYRSGGKPGGQPVQSAGSPSSYDVEACRKLWEWSEEVTGVAFEV
jgi:NAD(P)-dependent dehydrogenase (short-subunit alcohol dehydrogenase family)